jgi:ferredoxin
MPGKYVVEADPTRCIGSGICAAVAPEIFELRDQRVDVRVRETDEDDGALEAEEICPARAIMVRRCP